MKSIKHPFSRRSLAKLCPPRVTFRFTIQFKRPATPLIFLMNLEAVARINPASFRPGILLTGEIPPWKTNIEAPVIVLINQEFVGKKKRIVNVSCIRKLIPPPPSSSTKINISFSLEIYYLFFSLSRKDEWFTNLSTYYRELIIIELNYRAKRKDHYFFELPSTNHLLEKITFQNYFHP